MNEGGLFAAHIDELGRFGEPDGAGGVYPRLRSVFTPPLVDPAHPWICRTNDWGAEILPDGSVLALFRNGGHHCANNSYPGWPSPGRHWHSTLSLAVIDCHAVGIYTVMLLSSLRSCHFVCRNDRLAHG